MTMTSFPFLFGGTFIEGHGVQDHRPDNAGFPFLFGGTFIEGHSGSPRSAEAVPNFPSFSEGLSLRGHVLLGWFEVW